MELKEKIQKQLLKVKSPSRYIGGEFNSVVKDKSKVVSALYTNIFAAV